MVALWYRRRQWHPTPVLLPGKSHGQRSLVGCSPWGRKESDTTERLHFPFSLSCIGEGHGNPLQCSCLENPRDGRAWWAATYGVAQSRTRLKRLSSSSSIVISSWHRKQLFNQLFNQICPLRRESQLFYNGWVSSVLYRKRYLFMKSFCYYYYMLKRFLLEKGHQRCVLWRGRSNLYL